MEKGFDKEFPLVSIVTVNFNQPEVTEELLGSLKKVTYPKLEIFVVDNGCEKGCLHLKESFPEVSFLMSKQNLGFAGGNNLAIRQAKGDFILLLNNDTEVDPGFLEPMVNLFRKIPELGIVSPLLLYHNRNLIQYAGARAINFFTGRGKKIGHKQTPSPAFEQARPTDLGHGAAMLFPRRLIAEVGYLPEEYFLYYEEHDWCEACKRAGYKVYFQGSSRVYHKESVSVGKANPLKTYYLNRNRLLFIQRNASGFQKVVAQLFYLFVAFPKNLLRHLLAGEKEHAKALLKAINWHIKKLFLLSKNTTSFKPNPHERIKI